MMQHRGKYPDTLRAVTTTNKEVKKDYIADDSKTFLLSDVFFFSFLNFRWPLVASCGSC